MTDVSPMLLCLDIERAFVDPTSKRFIPGAEDSLQVCELVLRHARRERWTIAHCFQVPAETSDVFDSRPIRGFEPLRQEMVFRRTEVSAYASQAFVQQMERRKRKPTFLIGFASSCQVLATIFDALSREHSVLAIFEAIQTPAAGGVDPATLNQAAQTVLKSLQCGFSAADMELRRPKIAASA